MLIKWSKAGGDEEKLTCGLLLLRMKTKLSAFLVIPLFCSFSSPCLLGAGVRWQRQWRRCVDWTKLTTLLLCSFFVCVKSPLFMCSPLFSSSSSFFSVFGLSLSLSLFSPVSSCFPLRPSVRGWGWGKVVQPESRLPLVWKKTMIKV